MKFGTIEIEEYVKPHIKVNPDLNRRKIIKHMKGNLYENESLFVRHLELAEYLAVRDLRQLDISFLSISQDSKNDYIRLPLNVLPHV